MKEKKCNWRYFKRRFWFPQCSTESQHQQLPKILHPSAEKRRCFISTIKTTDSLLTFHKKNTFSLIVITKEKTHKIIDIDNNNKNSSYFKFVKLFCVRQRSGRIQGANKNPQNRQKYFISFHEDKMSA